MSSKQPGASVRPRNAINSRKIPTPDDAPDDAPPKVLLIDCPHKDISKGRNLVVNLDGTANQFSEYNTNVVELFSRIIKDLQDSSEDHAPVQLVYYNSGIGTYARPSYRSWHYVKQVIDHSIDTAIAWNFEAIVHAAYEWISENYVPGDRIFLFGFSRGAYQARVIAGMIHRVGLLHKGNKSQIPFAYELYCSVTENGEREKEPSTENLRADGNATSIPNIHLTPLPNRSDTSLSNVSATLLPNRPPTQTPDHEEFLCQQFKASLCHADVKVHFVGAWDTVSSIGVLRGKSLPETVSGMGHVCAFRHALALDERRVKFQPEYVNGGAGPQPKAESRQAPKDVIIQSNAPKGETVQGPSKGKNSRGQGLHQKQKQPKGDVKEVWFAGSHSDIGGGSIRNQELKNFGPALRWMTYEAMNYGLRIRPYEGRWNTPELTESLVGFFWLFLELLPFPRLTYDDANSITLMPHLAAPRTVQPGQLIHQSVFSPRPLTVKPIPIICPTIVSTFWNWCTSFTRTRHPDNTEHHDIEVGPIPSAFPRPNEERKVHYRPAAILSKDLGCSWEDLFDVKPSASADKNNAKFIEKDPFEDASYSVTQLAEACASIESTTDQPPEFYRFDKCLTALQSFLNSKTRLASLLEVENVEKRLWSALEFAIRYPQATARRSRELNEALIRLVARAEVNEASFEARLQRPKASQLRKWSSLIGKAYQDDLDRVIERSACLSSFGLSDTEIHALKFSSNNHRNIFFGSSDSALSSGLLLGTWDTSKSMIRARGLDGDAFALSSDGASIAVADCGKISVAQFDVSTPPSPSVDVGRETTAPDDEHPVDDAPISWLCLSDDIQTVASGHFNGFIQLWHSDEGSWKVYKRIECAESKIEDLYFSPSNSVLAFTTRSTPRIAKLCWPADGKVVRLKGSEGASSIAWGPDSSLACGTRDGELIFWDNKQEKSHQFEANDSWISILAYRYDGQVLATGGSNGVIRIWNCEKRTKIWDFRAGTQITSIAFSNDGKRMASGDDYGGLYLWDVDLEENDEEDSHKPLNNKNLPEPLPSQIGYIE